MTLMNTYARFPITLVKGKGSWVWDDQGHKYLDFTSGIATCNLGHVPAAVQEALQQQLDLIWHCSNLFHIPAQTELAAKLVEYSCLDQVFFANSGAEANEGAIKLARKYGKEVAQKREQVIVTFTQSFHGRTMATLSATGQAKIQKGFEPLVPGFRILPFNDMAAIEKIDPAKTAAVLLELIQGEGGVIPAHPDWLNALVSYCRQHEILVMLDEIQTGMGRTGTLFAYQQFDFEPDVITLAKGLGSGFPIGAVLAKSQVAQVFTPGSHGSTFGGNPLAAAAGLASINYLVENDIPSRVLDLGEQLQTKLEAIKNQFPNVVVDVRGRGLLWGLVTPNQALDVVRKLQAESVLVLTAGPDVVRLLPPLTTTSTEMDVCLNALQKVLAS